MNKQVLIIIFTGIYAFVSGFIYWATTNNKRAKKALAGTTVIYILCFLLVLAFWEQTSWRTPYVQANLDNDGTLTVVATVDGGVTVKGLRDVMDEAARQKVRSIYIGGGIVNVNDYEFVGLLFPNLRHVDIAGCTRIGVAAFNGCTLLQTVNAGSCEVVERDAFGSCRSLTSVALPEDCQIHDHAFDGCPWQPSTPTNAITVELARR